MHLYLDAAEFQLAPKCHPHMVCSHVMFSFSTKAPPFLKCHSLSVASGCEHRPLYAMYRQCGMCQRIRCSFGFGVWFSRCEGFPSPAHNTHNTHTHKHTRNSPRDHLQVTDCLRQLGETLRWKILLAPSSAASPLTTSIQR